MSAFYLWCIVVDVRDIAISKISTVPALTEITWEPTGQAIKNLHWGMEGAKRKEPLRWEQVEEWLSDKCIRESFLGEGMSRLGHGVWIRVSKQRDGVFYTKGAIYVLEPGIS